MFIRESENGCLLKIKTKNRKFSHQQYLKHNTLKNEPVYLNVKGKINFEVREKQNKLYEFL